jgi:3-deoxy-manno-octulosonate cytidylyltransferase (CMP-KDO synthetase)
MIVHVWRRAMEADVGPVWVAADDPRVMQAVASAGGRAVMTRIDHPSGSDRIFEALGAIDASGVHDVVINIQGDLPTIEPSVVRACLAALAERTVDIATLATPITREQEKNDPNVVKVVATELDSTRLRALYFTRSRSPWGEGRLLHHIGLYAYRRSALRRFVAARPSPLERREKLEQLRALEMGMRIDVALVETEPLGVDAPEDLERARALLAPRKHA